MFLKNIFLILILSFFCVEPIMSQDTLSIEKKRLVRKDIINPNIIKINTLALMFSNASLIYERGIMPRLSAGIGIGYKYSGSEPKLFSNNNSDIDVNIGQIIGYSITPEIRYYLKTCNPNLLDGFYGGLYFRYTHFSTTADFTYLSASKQLEQNHADITLNEFGLGIQLGYQLLVFDRLSIDFLFFGPRISNYKFNYEFVEQPTQELLDNLSDYTNEIIDRFGISHKVNIQSEGELKASTSFSFSNARFGLSFGFAF